MDNILEKLQGFFNLLNSAKTTLFTIGVVIVALLNIWLSHQLVPVVDSVKTNSRDIQIVKAEVELVKKDCTNLPHEVELRLDARLKKIESDVERLDDRNLEIYKILINR